MARHCWLSAIEAAGGEKKGRVAQRSRRGLEFIPALDAGR